MGYTFRRVREDSVSFLDQAKHFCCFRIFGKIRMVLFNKLEVSCFELLVSEVITEVEQFEIVGRLCGKSEQSSKPTYNHNNMNMASNDAQYQAGDCLIGRPDNVIHSLLCYKLLLAILVQIINSLMNIFEEAWRNIISPPQIKSKLTALGPKEKVIKDKSILREDLRVINRNGKKLEGFLFYSPNVQATETILYLHGNGGSKLQAMSLVDLIPQFGFNLTAFDFLGCGNSDPSLLSYGVNEVFDIRDMLEQVRKHVKVTRITIWGRSMGSLCAIMFANMYAYEVNALILDAPFRSLSGVVQRIACKKVQIPLFLLKPFLYMIEQKANKQLGFDLFSIDYLSILKKLNENLPILFIFSNFDTIVPAQQVLEFYNSYHGPKDLCQIYRTHDQDRPEDLFKQGLMWITKTKRKNINAILQARELLHQQRERQQSAHSSGLCSQAYKCW